MKSIFEECRLKIVEVLILILFCSTSSWAAPQGIKDSTGVDAYAGAVYSGGLPFVLFSVQNLAFSSYDSSCNTTFPPSVNSYPRNYNFSFNSTYQAVCPPNMITRPVLTLTNVPSSQGLANPTALEAWNWKVTPPPVGDPAYFGTWTISGYVLNVSGGLSYCVPATVTLTVYCVPPGY